MNKYLGVRYILHYIIEKKKYLIISLIVIIFYLFPLLFLGQDSHILIHDNLDSSFTVFKILANSGEIFGSLQSKIPNFMDGIPRNTLGSEFNLTIWLFYFFKPFVAYTINLFLLHIIAFLGMYFLLKKHFIKDVDSEYIITFSSLCFALLPFYPLVGLSVAGLPLALNSFLNIRAGKSSKYDLAILLFIPFYSSFVICFVFFLAAMGFLWLYDLIKIRKLNWKFLFSIMLMLIMYLCIEYRLVYSMFFNGGYISHRTERILVHYDFITAIKESINNFIFGQYHAASLQNYFVGISVAVALLIILFKKTLKKDFVLLLIISFLISVWYGFWKWDGWLILKSKFDILNSFNFARFHFLHPLLWYVIFALSLNIIYKKLKHGKKIVLLLLTLQIMFLFTQSNEYQETKKNNPTFRQFYAQELFHDIREYIGKDQVEYRVVNIGLHPSIAQYNGFYTLDGYSSNYPLKYKHKFKQIIIAELEKNKRLYRYFDNWGSRCYIFVNELNNNQSMVTKDEKIMINNLKINSKLLYEMGCRYIFSAVKINNYRPNGLEFLKIFDDENSAWRIYLYKIRKI